MSYGVFGDSGDKGGTGYGKHRGDAGLTGFFLNVTGVNRRISYGAS